MRVNVYGIDEHRGSYLAGWFDQEKAEKIAGNREWDGQNMADVHVGANRGQNLYRTATDKDFVLETWSRWTNENTTYRFVTSEQAREWLLANESDEQVEKWFGEIEEEKGPGRPETVGGKPTNIKFGDDLTEQVRQRARDGEPFAATVRRLLWEAVKASPPADTVL